MVKQQSGKMKLLCCIQRTKYKGKKWVELNYIQGIQKIHSCCQISNCLFLSRLSQLYRIIISLSLTAKAQILKYRQSSGNHFPLL